MGVTRLGEFIDAARELAETVTPACLGLATFTGSSVVQECGLALSGLDGTIESPHPAPKLTETTVPGATMTKPLRVMVETGPKGKRVVAVAPDWPGLERGAKTEDAAIERLVAYVPRYVAVAKLAGLDAELDDGARVEVVERYPGTGSTDFWGISFAFSSFDHQPMSGDELERELRLMRACWAFFDTVRTRVSAEMLKGPRGGGRDRDQIVRHSVVTEQDWARKLGMPATQDGMLSDEDLRTHRDAYCTAIRTFHAEGKTARTWPLRYLIRHTAYHTMDHAWEMEDKDLTGTLT